MASGALPMGWEIEQHGPYSAAAHIVGEGRHEGCFAGPSVHQEHAGGALSFWLQNIGLNFADAGLERLGACRTQMKARTLGKPLMIRAAMARKARSAKRAQCASANDLGRAAQAVTPCRAALVHAANAFSAPDPATDRTYMERAATCKNAAYVMRGVFSASAYSQLAYDPTRARPCAGSAQTLKAPH
jgi:hypothetical protein